MKKLFVVFALFCTFFMISCGKGCLKEEIKRGELYGECYPDGTCNEGLVCDTEYNVCIEDPDFEDDEDKIDSDEIDSDSIDDIDKFDDTENDAESADPCDPDPCKELEHSNGKCKTVSESRYSCGCVEGYYWLEEENICTDRPTLGNICSGQKYCYDDGLLISCPLSDEDFYGQDAQYSEAGTCIRQDFTIKKAPGQNIVVDNNTSLEWQQAASDKEYMFEEAENYCSELVYGGYSDWRLPEPHEILSIVNIGQNNSFINNNFTNISADYDAELWTSHESKCLRVSEGSYSYCGSKSKNVLCVRGSKMKKGVFSSKTIDGDIVVIDAATALIWQKDSGFRSTWKEALKYCENLDYAGRRDWRLPNKNEVISLMDFDKSEEPYSDFPDIPDWLWSSSNSFYVEDAWCADFYSGYLTPLGYKRNDTSVRCVTGGRGIGPDDPCDPNPCGNIANSTGKCKVLSPKRYSCECAEGYYLWESENACLEKKPLTVGEICTGQTLCYENSSLVNCQQLNSAGWYGQDAQYAEFGVCEPQNFTVKTFADQNIVADNNTNLEWLQSPSSDRYDWLRANIYCADLNESGYAGYQSGWRLPTPQEFLTIADLSRFNPAVNPDFTNVMADYNACLWTSKRSNDDWQTAMVFIPAYGYITDNKATETCQTICVHGSEMEKGVFTSQTVNGDVVVTDSTTGLIWQKEYGQEFWGSAMRYCEELDYADRHDWRLPNKNELASLLNYDTIGTPASDFPDMPESWFWSSSVGAGNPERPWYVYFKNGQVAYTNSQSFSVRCVTGGKEVKTVNPCDPNPCGSFSNSTGVCMAGSEALYSCECASGYYWWNTEEGCVAAKPPSTGRICTGETKCYALDANLELEPCPAEGEDFYGQDAQYSALGICQPQSLTVDETVPEEKIIIDNNTGLKWQQVFDESVFSWEDALDHCENLNYGGFSSGWRVPSPNEYLSLGKAVNTTNFQNLTSGTGGYLWTSKNKGGDNAWNFKPFDGTIANTSKTFTYPVICVHGNEIPKGVFTSVTVNGTVVVEDIITGLMWQKESDFTGNWKEALRYCEDLELAGYTDWRLPNKNELASLLNHERLMSPYSDFPDMSRYNKTLLWSSTCNSGYNAIGVDFYYGNVSGNQKSRTLGVRCVR